jgi:hypothetical protein
MDVNAMSINNNSKSQQPQITFSLSATGSIALSLLSLLLSLSSNHLLHRNLIQLQAPEQTLVSPENQREPNDPEERAPIEGSLDTEQCPIA